MLSCYEYESGNSNWQKRVRVLTRVVHDTIIYSPVLETSFVGGDEDSTLVSFLLNEEPDEFILLKLFNWFEFRVFFLQDMLP